MKCILVISVCLLLASQVCAAEPSIDANVPSFDVNEPNVDANGILIDLEKAFSKIKTIQTDFTQTKKLKLFKHPVNLKGRVLLQVPDSLLWRVQEPVPYALLLKGKKAVEWDQETGKKKELPFAGTPVFEQILVQIKSWFSGEFLELKKNYDMSIVSRKPLILGFKPKAANSAKNVIEEIRVVIRTDRRYIESMTILEVNGDLTATIFANTLFNQEIPAKAWDVSPQ